MPSAPPHNEPPRRAGSSGGRRPPGPGGWNPSAAPTRTAASSPTTESDPASNKSESKKSDSDSCPSRDPGRAVRARPGIRVGPCGGSRRASWATSGDQILLRPGPESPGRGSSESTTRTLRAPRIMTRRSNLKVRPAMRGPRLARDPNSQRFASAEPAAAAPCAAPAGSPLELRVRARIRVAAHVRVAGRDSDTSARGSRG